MAMFTSTDIDWAELNPAAQSLSPSQCQRRRIMTALGLTHGRLPKVDDETLSRYYRYLAAKLPLPFVAYYPKPKDARQERDFRCVVLELLDPAVYLGDGFDGIFCKTRKGKYEINLPLIELEVPQDSPAFELIDDFWYWFWNWR
jgi:hypothetical protein